MYSVAVCVFCSRFRKTYRIESVTAASLVIAFCTWDGFFNLNCFNFCDADGSSSLVMSIEDDINHWVAAAYCRHKDFSFSTFCKINHRKPWKLNTGSKQCQLFFSHFDRLHIKHIKVELIIHSLTSIIYYLLQYRIIYRCINTIPFQSRWSCQLPWFHCNALYIKPWKILLVHIKI